MMREFRSDPYYLLRYYARSTALSVALATALYSLNWHELRPTIFPWLLCLVPIVVSSFLGLFASNLLAVGLTLHYYGGELTRWHLALIPAGIYLGMLNVPVIHNCAHGNFRPRWLNRWVGELCSLHLLSGFPGFAILHLEHHKHADDPLRDPHPNRDLTFWQYLNGLKRSLATAFARLHSSIWRDDPAASAGWRLTRALLPLNRVLRAVILLCLVGPVGFALFYVPSIIANQLFYAHINYFTHARRRDDSVEILNLNHTASYRWLNRLFLGIYFHGNHHRRSSAINPGKIA